MHILLCLKKESRAKKENMNKFKERWNLDDFYFWFLLKNRAKMQKGTPQTGILKKG